MYKCNQHRVQLQAFDYGMVYGFLPVSFAGEGYQDPIYYNFNSYKSP